jgi:mannose-6-phosphate isomerase-like protein (cupin superfamily)
MRPGTSSAGKICTASSAGGRVVNAEVDGGALIIPITEPETILRRGEREISVLVAHEQLSIIHARCSAGEQVTGAHIHHEHTDAFHVLEGELTFEIGREAKTVTISVGGLVAVPPMKAHSFRNDSDRPARWLTIHAPDGGFSAFMRGTREGVDVDWDIARVPADGGLPASQAIVSAAGGRERPASAN